jgi:hypothetical protein
VSRTFTDEQLIAAFEILYPDLKVQEMDGPYRAHTLGSFRLQLQTTPRAGYIQLHRLVATVPESFSTVRVLVELARVLFPDLCSGLGDFEVWEAMRGKPDSKWTSEHGDLARASVLA